MPHSVFAAPAPAAGALVLAGPDGARAGQAADRGKALGDQGMARQAGFRDVVEHFARAPADQRIDLDPLAFRFEQRQVRARRALEAFAAGDPRVIAVHRLGKRADLADVAAAVGIAGEQEFLRVLRGQNVGVRGRRDHIRELQGLAERVAIGQRLGEMLAGVDEDHRRRGVDLRDHVQERGGVRAEARNERDAAGIEIFDRQPQERRRLEPREAGLEPRGGDLVAEQLDVMRAHQMSDPALRS